MFEFGNKKKWGDIKKKKKETGCKLRSIEIVD